MKVTNRSYHQVSYQLAELKVQRNFASKETKNIEKSEIETLIQQLGGMRLFLDWLVIEDIDYAREIMGSLPHEYYWTEKDILDSFASDSIEDFSDTLQYAPNGVIEMIKSLAVSTPLTDYSKMQAIFSITGFDVNNALELLSDEEKVETPTSGRRRQSL